MWRLRIMLKMRNGEPMNDLIEIVDMQSEVVKTQSEVIDYLFMRLARYMTDKEMSELPIIPKVQDIARKIEQLKERSV